MGGKQSKRARRMAAAEELRQTVVGDEEFGIRLDWLRPGGGAERLRVTWDLPFETDVALMSVPRLLRLVDELTAELVAIHRDGGDSWDDIGWYLERPGESVRRRYGQAAS